MLSRVRSAVAHLVSSGGAPPPGPKSPDQPEATSLLPAVPPEAPGSPPAKAGSASGSAAAPAKAAEARASFSRPTFLQLSPAGLRRADDHAGRAVQSPPDTGRRLPWSTGYAEVINAGKSRHNEDQACCEVVYVEGRRSGSGAPREPGPGQQGLCFYYWGLFDGHAGGGAAEVASRLLHRHIREQLKDLVEILQDPSPPPLCLPSTPGTPGSSDPPHLVGPHSCWPSQKEVTHDSLVVGAIESAFQLMDEQMAQERHGHQVEGGCCALVVVYLLGKMYVANAGDSRAIIVRNGEIIPMSREFTPETERQRLQLLARVMATIGVTRGLGDHNLRVCSSSLPIKPFLSCFPEVRVYDLTQYEHCPDDVLVLGTDGLWDVTSDAEAAATVDRVLSTYEPNDPSRYTALAQALVLGARGTPRDRGWRLPNNKLGSGDDISVFVIPLGGPGSYS
ncbi:protein phosphatase 1J isoform X3 [Pipistrellus kuhlii]|uniref:protein phosphatase 1J isoform X3 n=1 Tax=Pipistrellus kuhlii TaxID=59472 RepID=UPI00174F01A0|nr:protein phosphatase 1J isoform X3 [Pipistrellus kuhlii]